MGGRAGGASGDCNGEAGMVYMRARVRCVRCAYRMRTRVAVAMSCRRARCVGLGSGGIYMLKYFAPGPAAVFVF